MRYWYIAVMITCLWGRVGFASSPMDDLLVLLKKTDSFQADFSQKIKSATGEKISSTKGSVVIRRPDQFYWKSLRPDPVLVVADGKYLWTYDADLGQATKQNLQKALKNSPATLLVGSLDNFKNDFIIDYAKSGACQKGKDKCFRLRPKQKDSPFRNILIGFSNDSLVEIRMFDPLDQDVYTVFTHVQINKPVNTSLFNFLPPKGVDVIHYD